MNRPRILKARYWLGFKLYQRALKLAPGIALAIEQHVAQQLLAAQAEAQRQHELRLVQHRQVVAERAARQ